MKRLTCLALPLLLAACSSKAPLNYHTLTSAAEPAASGRAALAPLGRVVVGSTSRRQYQ